MSISKWLRHPKPFSRQCIRPLNAIFWVLHTFFLCLHIYHISGKGAKIGEMGVDLRRNTDTLCATCNLWVLICTFFERRKHLRFAQPPSFFGRMRPPKGKVLAKLLAGMPVGLAAGGGGGDSACLWTQPTPPPTLGGLPPTLGWQRCRPEASIGGEGAQSSMGTQGAHIEKFSLCTPTLSLDPTRNNNIQPNPA